MARVRPSTFALVDLGHVLGGVRREAWLLHDDDLGWAWWTAIEGDENIVAYARVT